MMNPNFCPTFPPNLYQLNHPYFTYGYVPAHTRDDPSVNHPYFSYAHPSVNSNLPVPANSDTSADVNMDSLIDVLTNQPNTPSPTADTLLQYLDDDLNDDGALRTLKHPGHGTLHGTLLYQRFTFLHKRSLKSGNIVYRCSLYKKKSGCCPATITVDATKTTVLKTSRIHNHLPRSPTSVDRQLSTNALLLDVTEEASFPALAHRHGITPTRKLRVQRIRHLSRMRSTSSSDLGI